MRIIIVGAGQVGYHLADRLSHQGQDVVVIDTSAEKAELIGDRLDVMTIVGNGASVSVLEDAGVGKADLFLAVTNRDEVNILGCLAAERMGDVRKVARISNADFLVERSVLSHEHLGIDLMINPERECAWETYQLFASQAASELIPFANGQVNLVGLKVQEGAPVAGRTIKELGTELRGRRYTTVAIVRDGVTEIPNGASRIEAGDRIFLITPASEMSYLPALAGVKPYPLRRVMIAGGSAEAMHLARFLDAQGVDCIILDRDRQRCVELSTELSHALVLHGDATDAELLEMEGVAGIDGYVAYTNKDETNLLSAVLAKSLGARKVIAMLHRRQYMPVAARLDIDATVSPRLSAANAILRYVHTANVSAVAALRGIDAEAVELVIGSKCRALGKPFRDVDFPEGGLVAAIVRDGELVTPRGDDHVQVGDHVVLFSHAETMPRMEKLFA
ncbi:MAG: Trk system potassium transporter TrkA [Gemmatimonadota bacterium]